MTKECIQSTGSYDSLDECFSLTFCPSNNYGITFEGLSIEDMNEIKSLVDILIENYNEINMETPNGIK